MRLILLKPKEEPQIITVNKNNIDLAGLIESDAITCITRKIDNTYFDFYIDDCALFRSEKYVTAMCRNTKEFLCGNILIAAHGTSEHIEGLSKFKIEKIMDKFNWVCNESVTKRHNEIPIRTTDYGPVYLHKKGYLLIYGY